MRKASGLRQSSAGEPAGRGVIDYLPATPMRSISIRQSSINKPVVPTVVLGVPLVWLYVFVVWSLLIALVALTMRKR